MRASRIFALARTMRWATVGGPVRKARAISSVVRPQTSRKVSAIWASGGRAGWQQVKRNRNRSSSTLSPSRATGSLVSTSNRRAISSSDASNRARRRIASMALKRPADTSHARGLAGTPHRGDRPPGDVMAALLDSLGEGVVLAHERVRLALGHGADLLLLIVNQAEVLHNVLPNRGGTVCGHQIVVRGSR